MSRGPRITMLSVAGAQGASTRYRVLAYRPALEAAGYDVAVRAPLQRSGPLRRAWRAADLLRDIRATANEQILFVHRKMYPPGLAPLLKRAGRKIVFDMDDAIDLPPPSRTLSSAGKSRYRRNFVATVDVADLVLCGNSELARRLPHRRFAVLETPIDTLRFAPAAGSAPPAEPTLGWVGHSDNLGYLESLDEPLRELARRHPALRVIVVADRPPRLPGVDVEFRRWTLKSEVSCFRGMAVGLMPLADTPWARGKCAFKAIQYMALGIPAVASPVGMNREVIDHGATGFLPGTDREWVESLDLLLSDAGLREQIAGAARRAVEQRYSLEVLSRRLVAILNALDADAPRGV